MSGGGNDIQKIISGATSAAKPTIASLNPSSTVQPFMPGLDQSLANQLAQGFGGNPQDFLSAFSQVYSPMQVPQNPTFTDLPAATGKDKKPVQKNVGGYSSRG